MEHTEKLNKINYYEKDYILSLGVFLLQIPNSDLTIRKTSDKTQMRVIPQNT